MKKLLPAATRLLGFAHPSYRSGIERLGIFDRVIIFGEKFDRSIDVLADLTSYDYSYATAALQDYGTLIRRDLEEPWKIHVISSSDRITYTCPALQPGTGWFASDSHASAMLCELPILNLCFDLPIGDLSPVMHAHAPLHLSSRSGSSGPEILFLMGGTSRAKHYPVQEWLALEKGLLSAGRRTLTVTGPDEGWLLRELAANGMPYVVITDLGDLMDRILTSTAVIANDCGPMHVALMLGHPTLGVFGPTIPEAWFCPTKPEQTCIQKARARRQRSDLVNGNTWADWPQASDVLQHVDAVLSEARRSRSIINYVC